MQIDYGFIVYLTGWEVLLTAWTDITKFDPHMRIERETPWSLHLPSWVPAEVMPPSKFWIVCRCHMMAVGVLSCPGLTLVA